MKNFLRETTVMTVLASATLAIGSSQAFADVVHADDTIIQGSLCVGFDCVNGENFSFDTLRLKENNLRIHFLDTSNSGSFPSRDWRIVINDTSNGGGEYFAIEDSTAGRVPVRVDGNAPSNSLRISSSGNLGVGTGTPVTTMHAATGNTPTLRLEQNTSSGFTAQTWDLAGNEANFFIRDVTNSSRLPFRIRPGAPTSSIDIAADGDVFIGVDNNSTNSGDLVIGKTDNAAVRLLDIASSTATQLRLVGNTENRRIVARDADGGAADTQLNFGSTEITFLGPTASDVWATISAAGIVTNIGSCTTASPCDGVFDPDIYTVPSIDEHAALMWSNQHLPAVGPTRQGEPVNITAKMTGMLNELEHAHIYIEQLHERVSALEAARSDG